MHKKEQRRKRLKNGRLKHDTTETEQMAPSKHPIKTQQKDKSRQLQTKFSGTWKLQVIKRLKGDCRRKKNKQGLDYVLRLNMQA